MAGTADSRAGRIEVRLEPRAGRLRVSIRDEGVGIPQAEQQRIFEKFYRVDANMSHGVSGTGLGLYICRELVRRMGGGIWVESNEGGGSMFFVELPLASGEQRSPENRRPEAGEGFSAC